MIPLLITWLIKRKISRFGKIEFARQNTIIKIICIAILILFFFIPAMAQNQRVYTIVHNGDKIGNMKINRLQNNDDVEISIESDINIRMITKMHVTAKEKSIYKSNRLIYSTVYREINGKQKANRKTQFKSNYYELNAEGNKRLIKNAGINFNLAMLYFFEPIDNKEIYSDYYQQLIEIKSINSHVYKLQLPNGNYNIYHYTNNTCTKVDVHSSFYTVQIQLV